MQSEKKHHCSWLDSYCFNLLFWKRTAPWWRSHPLNFDSFLTEQMSEHRLRIHKWRLVKRVVSKLLIAAPRARESLSHTLSPHPWSIEIEGQELLPNAVVGEGIRPGFVDGFHGLLHLFKT